MSYVDESTSTSTDFRAKLEIHEDGYMRYERDDPHKHKVEGVIYPKGEYKDKTRLLSNTIGKATRAPSDSSDEGACAWGRAGPIECGFVCHCYRCMHSSKRYVAPPAESMKDAVAALREAELEAREAMWVARAARDRLREARGRARTPAPGRRSVSRSARTEVSYSPPSV